MVTWLFSCLLFATIPGQADCTIVYFGSANCAPCERITPALEQLKSEGWDIRAVNAPQRPDLAKQYKIDNLPTVVIVSQQASREVDRIVGAVSYEQLHSRFTRAAARHTTASEANLQAPKLLDSQQQLTQQQLTQQQLSQQPQLQLQQPSQDGPTVRGQSPGPGGFPLLAAASAASSSAAAAIHDLASYDRSSSVQHAVHNRSLPPSEGQRTAHDNSLSLAADQPSNKLRQSLSLSQAITRALAATVRIKVEEENTTAYGSGTIIDVHGSQALVLTCGHLFRDMKNGSQLSVDLFAGTPNEINVLAELLDFKAEDEDIGLVTFTLPVAIDAVELLPKHETLQVGQPAFSFGCDHGQPPTKRDTKIRSINRYLGAANVEIVGAPAIGRSGGGLFDQQGRLIGVCNAACAEDDEGIYAAADVVYTQLKRLQLSHLFEPNMSANGQHLAADSSGNPSPINQLSAPVQPASYAATASPTSNDQAWTSPGARDDFAWPDQQLASSTHAANSHSVAENHANTQLGNASSHQFGSGLVGNANAASPQEIICIVRDASGQSRVVTIPSPAPELLDAIEHHSASPLSPK